MSQHWVFQVHCRLRLVLTGGRRRGRRRRGCGRIDFAKIEERGEEHDVAKLVAFGGPQHQIYTKIL